MLIRVILRACVFKLAREKNVEAGRKKGCTLVHP